MISYQLFLEYVKENILSYMPGEYGSSQVEIVRAVKENDQVYEGIAMIRSAAGIRYPAVLYCESFYKEYLQSGNTDSMMKRIADTYVAIESKGYTKNYPDVTRFEDVKSMIGYSVVNEKWSREMLVDIVYKCEEDLAKVYKLYAFDEEECSSLKISNELMEVWGVTVEQLDELANQNMPRMFPPVVGSSEKILMNLLFKDEDFPVGICVEPGDFMYAATIQFLKGGASVIFYPGLLETVRQQLGEDYYILPGSTDEVYILPKGKNSPAKLGELVCNANRKFNSPEQILAECVYEYTREAGKIRKVPESELVHEKQRGIER